MVARYGVISCSKVTPHLNTIACFHFFRDNKHKMLTKSSKVFVHVIFDMHSVKHFQFPPFSSFLMLSEIQNSGQNGLGWRHWPPEASQPIIYISPCRAHYRQSIKGKIFSKYNCNTTKTQGKGTIKLLPRRLYHGRVRPREKRSCTKEKHWIMSGSIRCNEMDMKASISGPLLFIP